MAIFPLIFILTGALMEGALDAVVFSDSQSRVQHNVVGQQGRALNFTMVFKLHQTTTPFIPFSFGLMTICTVRPHLFVHLAFPGG